MTAVLSNLLELADGFDFKLSQWVYQLKPVSHKLLHLLCATGEGYFWLAAPIPIVWLFSKFAPSFWTHVDESLWVNLLIVNLIDLIAIVVCKCTFRRPRPNYQLTNTTAQFLGPDKHSFPSGHTSRCFTILLLVLLFRSNGRVSSGLCWATGVWAAAVSLSRVLLGRHYLGDLAGGFVLAHINMLLYSRFASGATRLEDLSPWSSTFFLR